MPPMADLPLLFKHQGNSEGLVSRYGAERNDFVERRLHIRTNGVGTWVRYMLTIGVKGGMAGSVAGFIAGGMVGGIIHAAYELCCGEGVDRVLVGATIGASAGIVMVANAGNEVEVEYNSRLCSDQGVSISMLIPFPVRAILGAVTCAVIGAAVAAGTGLMIGASIGIVTGCAIGAGIGVAIGGGTKVVTGVGVGSFIGTVIGAASGAGTGLVIGAVSGAVVGPLIGSAIHVETRAISGGATGAGEVS